MIINTQKTKEIVFHRPSPRTFFYPVPVDRPSIEQVTSAKLIGVILHECLRFDEHVRHINAIMCSAYVFALTIARPRPCS